MTRQIALGAVIAFSLTVLGLSVWEPKAPAPEPTPPPAPAMIAPGLQKAMIPAKLKNDGIGRAYRTLPVMMMQTADAGAPAP